MFEHLLTSDLITDSAKAALGGLTVGAVFGFSAQRSDFCLRAATIEFWGGKIADRFAVWLLVFGSALVGVQLLFAFGLLPAAEIRQLANPGSMSGAIFGGLIFGSGMVLARGCASRLLVLSATGNMRALMTGLLLTVIAQAALKGALSPAREQMSRLWVVDAATRDMGLYLPASAGLIVGLMILFAAMAIGWRHKIPAPKLFFGAMVGLAVAMGWAFTASLSAMAFDPVSIESVTFTGPSADTLMALINQPDLPLNFGIGLVPGVFIGSGLSAVLAGTFKLQGFSDETGMGRYLVGAVMMGFGGMLAGGCAVGAGVTGGSVLSLTAWVALFAMWIAAGLTHFALQASPGLQGAR